jgi:TolB-like protein
MRSRAQGGVVLAAALVAAALIPGAAEAQRIAPLPKPCHVEGTELLHLPPRIPGSLAISIFASDSTDADGELAGGIADAVANRIGSAIPRILVIGRRAQRRLVVADSLGARAMADSLGATYVLAGRVSEGIRGRTVGFTLYNGVTGRALMYRTLPHDSAHVMLVEQNVSAQVASQILGKLKPQEQRALDRVPDVTSKAYDLYVRGQGARDVWNFGQAADYFRQATRFARSLAPA